MPAFNAVLLVAVAVSVLVVSAAVIPSRSLADNASYTTNATRSAFRSRRYRPTRSLAARKSDSTPAPTGPDEDITTVHITSESDFSLLLPFTDQELISEAESDGKTFCTPGSGSGQCVNRMQEGLITAAKVQKAEDGSFVQITGCLNSTKFHFAQDDEGGQLDVRYPNGAKCTFGGYGKSFIEQVEPKTGRFCLRCCAAEDDQLNCNSHHDQEGCAVAVPGTYNFPDVGVDCS